LRLIRQTLISRNEAVALIKNGDVEVARGTQRQSAIASYQEALRIREQLSSAANLDIYLRRDLAEACLKLGAS
jgi:hypothetical protein